MEEQTPKAAANPLATESIPKLLARFAVPSVISMLVNALYNIVDQIFIGQGIGEFGNAATIVAFPLVTISAALALLLGVGSASNFNLCMGRGEKDDAARFIGNGTLMLAICGTVFAAVVLLFLEPLMHAFGATANVLPFALTYTGITALGIPFMIVNTGTSHMIRADGNPRYAMFCVLFGAVLNTILDPLFIFVFKMGIAGAAWATIIGQILSCGLSVWYMLHYKTVRLGKAQLRLSWQYIRRIMALGVASCFNQLAMTVVQIAMNNTLRHYGAASRYGEDIPLACVGVISKVNMVYMSLMVGTAQGCQPIVGFNYGAKNYARVKKTYLSAFMVCGIISLLAFACFQLFPRQIISIFGSGSEMYYAFSERYIRVFMLLTFLNGVQPLTSTFFTSIGKATKGLLLSLTRQFLFLLPLILILPTIFGIDGVMYAGPIADAAAAVAAALLIVNEWKKMNRLQLAQPATTGP